MSDSKLSFKTNIQLKSIIGKDLINDDNIAILELVKNSFDAGSNKAIITYLNLKKNDDSVVESFSDKTSKIIIQDYGTGMDLIDIRDKWLNIAYSEKKSNQRQHRRMMAGAKGVGRFSCDRLGEYLNLYAKKKSSDKYVLLKIDWKLFEAEDQDKEIQSIELDYELLNDSQLIDRGIQPFEGGHGVRLEIMKLRSKWVSAIKDKEEHTIGWNTDKLFILKKYLEKLINPHQAFETNDDFGIYLEAPDFVEENAQKPAHEKFIGRIENSIFDKLDFRTTSIECSTLDDGEIISTELKDRGETVFKIKEKNPYYPFVKNAKITLYYLNPYAKAFFTKQTGMQSVHYGSIFLFINGFRIPPYGEVDNDWLGLNQRKTQGVNRRIGLRELVGSVEILDPDNDFQIVSSREGIVRNDNYLKLTMYRSNDSFIFKALRRLERYVVEGISWDSIPEEAELTYDQIAKKIVAGTISEEELSYREDEQIKNKRVYESIHNIISARPENVYELYINEKLILQKIEIERDKSEQEFEQLISDFENKKIDTDTLNRILERKAKENKELDNQLREFTKYETSPATTKAILELQQYKKTIEEQASIIIDLRNQLEQLTKETEASKQEISQAEKIIQEERSKRITAERERDFARSKSKYLQARSSLSKEEIAFEHLINNYSQAADTALVEISQITEKISLPKELHEQIDILRLYVRKIGQLTKLLNKADIKTLSENRDMDITQYTVEYFTDFSHTSKSFEVVTYDNSKSPLWRNTNMLDLSIVYDNLIFNALKAKANEIEIHFDEIDGHYVIDISDNGNGVEEPLLSHPEEMFEPGITTRSGGSGVGLNSVRDVMRHDLFGDIVFVGNNVHLKGATFRLIF